MFNNLIILQTNVKSIELLFAISIVGEIYWNLSKVLFLLKEYNHRYYSFVNFQVSVCL